MFYSISTFEPSNCLVANLSLLCQLLFIVLLVHSIAKRFWKFTLSLCESECELECVYLCVCVNYCTGTFIFFPCLCGHSYAHQCPKSQTKWITTKSINWSNFSYTIHSDLNSVGLTFPMYIIDILWDQTDANKKQCPLIYRNTHTHSC